MVKSSSKNLKSLFAKLYYLHYTVDIADKDKKIKNKKQFPSIHLISKKRLLCVEGQSSNQSENLNQ